MELFFKFLTGVAIAGLSSWITVNLSLKRFRTEKWWEKKADTYSSLLGAIHDSKAFAEDNLEAEKKGRELSKEQDSELRSKSVKAEAEIYKVMDIGAFYLSQEAIERLKRYKVEMSKAGQDGSWINYLCEDLEATDSCLKDIIEIARKDLQVK